MANGISFTNIPNNVLDIIYEKQLEYSKQKHRKVNLSQTIAMMIEAAYLTGKKLHAGKEKTN